MRRVTVVNKHNGISKGTEEHGRGQGSFSCVLADRIIQDKFGPKAYGNLLLTGITVRNQDYEKNHICY